MINSQDIIVLEKLTNILKKLNINYAVGGSIASSVYGVVRFTQDADITVEPFGPDCDRFFEELKDDFYISKEAVYQALQNKSSFNVIHFATAFKIDIFVRTDTEFQRQMLTHRRNLKLGDGKEELSFVSPEDIILLKLDWYRQSDCVSERQWSDIQGVLGGQTNSLDYEYLKNWAKKLGLEELLNRAILESET